MTALGHTPKRERGRSVVVVVPDFDPSTGGTSRQSRHQAEDLIRRGVATQVLTRRRRRRWPSTEIVHGVPVRRVRPSGWGSLVDKASVLTMGTWLARHRRELGMVEVVMYPDYAWAAVAAGLGERTVMVWAGHGDATDTIGPATDRARHALHAARRRALDRCHHVALTGAIERELRSFGFERVECVGVPVDTTRFRPPTPPERAQARADLGLADGTLALAYSGHLRRIKGVDRLIDAYGMLLADAPQTRLFLMGAGAGPDACEEELRARAARLGLARKIVFTGAVRDVERYLRAADVFVLPSRREGMANSLVEAMACGLACVAGPESGGDELLVDGAGVVPASNEPANLVEALRSLVVDTEGRLRMGHAAELRAKEMSVERVGDRYFALYEKLVNGG